jgi:hypothetical protein
VTIRLSPSYDNPISPNLASVTTSEHGSAHTHPSPQPHEGGRGTVSDQPSTPVVRVVRVGRWVWALMMIGIGVEFVTGVTALLLVPVDRSSGWLPVQGQVAYLVHAGLGGCLTLAALCLLHLGPQERIGRAGVRIGLAGLVLGACGGMLTAYHPTRWAGLLLMLMGTMVALLGYLMPLADPADRMNAE